MPTDALLAHQLAALREEILRLQAKPVYGLERSEIWGVVWKLFGVIEQLARRP